MAVGGTRGHGGLHSCWLGKLPMNLLRGDGLRLEAAEEDVNSLLQNRWILTGPLFKDCGTDSATPKYHGHPGILVVNISYTTDVQHSSQHSIFSCVCFPGRREP